MSLFLGTHRSRLDAKGRISIPASFRAPAREGGGAPVFVLRPSHAYPCIECWPLAVFERLSEAVAQFPTFSPEHEDLASSLHSDAHEAAPDREGRIVLPGFLTAHAGLSEEVVFMGHGTTFQIWEPEAASRRREEARSRTRARGLTLPTLPGAPSDGAAASPFAAGPPA